MSKKQIKQKITPLVVILLACLLIWTYIRIKAEETTEEPSSISLELVPEYKIITGADIRIWPRNTVLNQGMAAYFYKSEPIIYVTPVIRVKGANQSRLDGSIKASIGIRAVNDKAEPYWSYNFNEKEKESFILYNDNTEDNQLMSYKAQVITLDPVKASEMADQINNELLQRSGINQLVMTTDIEIGGTINGLPVEYNIKQELPVTLQPDSFTIPKTMEMISELPINLSNYNSSNQLLPAILNKHAVLLAADVFFTGLLIFLLFMSKTGNKAERNRFKEWITEGTVQLQDKLPIKIFKLQGLVDLAIDLDKRVIYDPGINKYFILDENIAYIYDPEHVNSIIENKTKLGKLLLDSGLLQPEQLELGLHYQKLTGMRLGESLTALGLIDETALYSTLAAQRGIDYYELDEGFEFSDLSWLNDINVIKARALMSVPLGKNPEGKQVIACAEPAREGIKNALHDLFGEQIILVAAKPTSVLKALDKIDRQQSSDIAESLSEGSVTLSSEEKKRFIDAYLHGRINNELLLKAAGLQPKADKDLSSLLKGLDKAVEEMKYADRQEGKLPDILDVLIHANFISADTARWVADESMQQKSSISLLLKMNYLASEGTIKAVEQLLLTLKNMV